MSNNLVSPVCVYTIVHTNKLDKLYRDGGNGQIEEKRNWASAHRLLQEAKRSDMKMLIVFAAAEYTSDLLYYANLEAIKIDKSNPKSPVTTLEVSKLTPFEEPKPNKTSLMVKSTGRAIPEGQIRPYVICKTPRELMR
jgi:hypothetical protein